jgi:hypothetical protein
MFHDAFFVSVFISVTFCQECKYLFAMMQYISVLLQAIIYAIQVAFRRPRDKAEKIFTEGFTSTKEELRLQQHDILRQKLTEEEQEQVQRRIERTAQRMGIIL